MSVFVPPASAVDVSTTTTTAALPDLPHVADALVSASGAETTPAPDVITIDSEDEKEDEKPAIKAPHAARAESVPRAQAYFSPFAVLSKALTQGRKVSSAASIALKPAAIAHESASESSGSDASESESDIETRPHKRNNSRFIDDEAEEASDDGEEDDENENEDDEEEEEETATIARIEKKHLDTATSLAAKAITSRKRAARELMSNIDEACDEFRAAVPSDDEESDVRDSVPARLRAMAARMERYESQTLSQHADARARRAEFNEWSAVRDAARIAARLESAGTA